MDQSYLAHALLLLLFVAMTPPPSIPTITPVFQAGRSAHGQRGGSGRPLSPVVDDDAFVGFLNEAARRIL
jgi:hypothetical protein